MSQFAQTSNVPSVHRMPSIEQQLDTRTTDHSQAISPSSPRFDALSLSVTRSRSHSQSRAAGLSSGGSLRPRLSSIASNATARSRMTSRSGRPRSQSSISQDPEFPHPPRPPSPPPEEANAPPPAEEVTPSRLAAHYAILVWASMLGCLARLGLNALGTYDGAVIYALAWSQGVGSGVMGFSLARKNEIVMIYPPVYTFLTTGIAGSITTFSSWMLAGYMSFSDFNGYDRGGFHDTVDGVIYSLSTFAIAMASLRFGEYLGRAIPTLPVRKHDRQLSEKTSYPESSETNGATESNGNGSGLEADTESVMRYNSSQPRAAENGTNGAYDEDDQTRAMVDRFDPLTGRTLYIDLFTIGTASLAYLLVLILYFFAPHLDAWRHDVLFPLLLAPPGAMARFALGRLNAVPPFIDRFPLGTFIINMIATLVISGTYAASRLPSNSGITRCDALYAIQQGFCGCASTVSTFVVEARTVKGFKWKALYVGGSVVLGHLFVLAIVGGVSWDRGYSGVCTGSPI